MAVVALSEPTKSPPMCAVPFVYRAKKVMVPAATSAAVIVYGAIADPKMSVTAGGVQVEGWGPILGTPPAGVMFAKNVLLSLETAIPPSLKAATMLLLMSRAT